MKARRIYFSYLVCLMTLVLMALHAPAFAADRTIYSKPLYALDVQNSFSDQFTYTADWFMTTSVEEMQKAHSEGWVTRGVACYTSPVRFSGTVPLYRIYNPTLRDHVYTSNSQESTALQRVFYVPEGIVGYVFPKNSPGPGTVPLHRFYAGGSYSYHRYSLSSAKVMKDEKYEGVECYVWPQGQAIGSLPLLPITR